MLEQQSYSGERPFNPDREIGPDAARVVDALKAAAATPNEVSAELRGAVCEYVGLLKARGYAAEHVVILLNSIMLKLGIDKGSLAKDKVAESVVSICVEEFYRAD